MRSAEPLEAPPADRTAKARIRDAAIDCFAEHGVADTTARRVAARAGVSPGLVMHHFGSMERLRAACDDYVAAVIREHKTTAMEAGPDFDVLAALRRSRMGLLAAYLAQVLVDDSPAVAGLVDELVADAEAYLDRGVASGMLRPTTDRRGRAAVLVLWSLGALVLHRHVARLLGVDLTEPGTGDHPDLASYARPAYEILSDGIFTETFGARVREAFAVTPATTDRSGSDES